MAQDYAAFYPIGTDPSIRFSNSYRTSETILFEAHPTARFNFFNNFVEVLTSEKGRHGQGWYVSARPQIRMYTGNSLPVKMPSYRVLIGTQHIFRIPPKDSSSNVDQFYGISIESGHYSNGQSGCAFSTRFADGSNGCNAEYDLIDNTSDLSLLLNRINGNFSTNLTEIIFNYRRYMLDTYGLPKRMHSFDFGYTLYHDRFLGVGRFGGYSENDIRIYGRHRFLLGYEFTWLRKAGEGWRITLSQRLELIHGAHEHVDPIRAETQVTFFPFKLAKEFGFLISLTTGHDNYNYRFVDSGTLVGFGFTWDQFPPLSKKSKRALSK